MDYCYGVFLCDILRWDMNEVYWLVESFFDLKCWIFSSVWVVLWFCFDLSVDSFIVVCFIGVFWVIRG